MNLVFRVVRRKSDGQKVVASELAKSSVAGLSCTMALLSSLAMSGAAQAVPDVVIDSGSAATLQLGASVATRVYDLNDLDDEGSPTFTAGSNTTLTAELLNIVAPESGVSHNKFTQFNVGANGLILNNVASGKTYNLSKETSLSETSPNELTVKVIAPNSLFGDGPSAGLIINEVLTGGSRSSLQGFIEVAGAAANVVIANPYGITANGVSFINADRVTLATGSVTGTPTVNSVIFDLSEDNYLLAESTATTVDGVTTYNTSISATDLVLVSRAVTLNGKVLATNDLTVVTSDGSVEVNPNTGAITTTASTSTTGSSYGIDSSALGGMYANAITLIANELGAGVSVLGDMAALGDAITITADGNLVVGETSTLEANSIALTSKTGNVSVTNTTVAARTNKIDGTIGGTLSITATAGDLLLSGATLSADTGSVADTAEGTLVLTAGNNATLVNSDISGEALTINATQTLSVDDTSAISARESLEIEAASIATLDMAITTGTGTSTIKSTFSDSDITFGANAALSGANVTIDSARKVALESGASIATSGDLSLVGTEVTSAAALSGANVTIDSAGKVAIESGASIATSGDLSLVGTEVTSAVALSVGEDFVIGDTDTTSIALGVSGTETLASVGGILTVIGDTISIFSDLSVTGSATLTGDSVSSTVTLNEQSNATIKGGLTVTGHTLVVNGTIAQPGAIALNATKSATSGLTIGSKASLVTTDSANVSLLANGLLSNQGMVNSAGTLTMGSGATGSSLTNTGTLQSAGNLSINVAGMLDNQAVVNSAGTLTIGSGATGSSLTNTGTLQSAGNLSINVAGMLDNQAVVNSAGTLTIGSDITGSGVTGSSLTNTGTLQSAGNLSINVAGTLYNQAVVASIENGRNLGKRYDSSTETSATTDTIEQTLLVDEGQIGLIKSTTGKVTLKAALTINEGDVAASGALDLTDAALRNQLAGIYGSTVTGVDGASTREALVSARNQYNYVNSNGVESYATDDYLLAGRANYVPSIKAATLTGPVLNIGGKVTGSGATITEIDVSLNRAITTNSDPITEPDTTGTKVAITADAPIVANGTTNTSVQLASNNATWVVNIAQPNASGLSNNTYSLFNINTNGAIFNNMPFKESVTVETDLSAVIVGNPTLTSPATVILNQVFSTGASKLNGFLEVAGKRADVLIVNPMGIVCDACGSINVDRFDLVVGSVTLSGGGISALNVAQTDASFLVAGDGLDATTTTLSSVIAPAITVAASVNTKNAYFGIGSGSFTRDVDGYSRNDSVLSAAVNSTSLLVTSAGGIFADDIEVDSKVSGSSSGPIMRIAGEIAANKGDLSIQSDGSISILGRVSASNDVTLATTSAANSEYIANADLQLINGAITSGKTLLLDVAAGSLVFNGGQIYSFADLTINGKTLIDNGTDNPAEFNNTRFTKTDLNFNIEENMAVTGTSWEANNFLFNKGMRPNLVVGEGGVMKALTLSDMTLTTLKNSGTLASLDRTTMDVSGSVSNLATGIVTSTNSSLLVTPTFTNDGNWIGSTVNATDSSVPNVVWQVDTITNNRSGVIASVDEWSINANDTDLSRTSSNKGVFVNQGTVTSQLALNANLKSLTNSGEFTVSLSDSGSDSVWTIDSLTNQSSGTLFAGDNWSVNAGGVTDSAQRGATLSNMGVMQGYRNLTLAFGSLAIGENTNISGALKGTTGSANDTFTLAVTNATALSGLIFSNYDLDATFTNGLTINTVGKIEANRNAKIETVSAGTNIDNLGSLYAGQDLALTSTNDIDNSGLLHAGQDLALTNTNDIDNRGSLYAGQDLALTSTNNIDNLGSIYAGRNLLASTGNIDNFDSLYAGNDLTLTSTGTSTDTGKIDNLGFVYAVQNLALNSTNDIDNFGLLYAGNDLTLVSAKNIGNFATVSYTAGRTLGYSATNGRVYSELKQVEQARADMRADGDISVTAANLFVNSAEVRSGGALTVDAATISNQVQRAANYDITRPITNTNGAKINYGSSESSNDFYTYPDNNTLFSKTETWNEYDYFKDGTPAVTPIMLSDGEFVLKAATVNNYGGVINSTSGDSSITVTTSLTNDSLSLHQQNWEKVSTREINYIALGPLTKGDTGWRGANPASYKTISNISGSSGWSDRASITAPSLALSGGTVTNKGSYTATDATDATPTTASKYSASSQLALSPAGGLITVSLPTSPNGFFVTNKDPSAKYLVEMNPKLQSGVSTLGSDYLMETLNINTDTTVRRLGDASYEAYLVEQQLLEATGKSVLDSFNSTADMMKGLMDNAANQAGSMGLTYGKPLTEEQLEALDEPFVWMVEIEVNGQKVLAPKVYLPKTIRAEIAQKQAIISADDLTMDVTSLDNLGGNIEAKNNLDITSEGDINNISGGISGNNVSVKSTQGNINNETFNQYGGNENSGQTVIGKTATISANNDLALDAAGDITNIGAEMNAGNDATLKAGGDITFDTIEDESRSYELSGSSNGLSSTVSETREKTINQVKSGLNVGNNLSTDSAGDTTFAGTDVNVGGDADIQSDGEINIIARENSAETSTKTQTAGIGVGGGILGIQTTTEDALSIRNVGSTFNVGGDATFTAEEDMTIQGSDLNAGGDVDIDAKGLNVLAGRDLDQTSTKTETATIGISIESEENVDGSTSEGVTFGQVVIETDERLSQRSVGSNMGIGGNLTVKTQEDVIIQGSEIDAGGDVDIDAEDIRMLAAQNIETVSKSKTTTKIGLYASTATSAEGEAGTETDAGYEYGAEQEGMGGSASAEAGASAKAGASGSASASATLDISRTRIDKEDTLSITNTGSAIRSGGSTKLKAENDLELVGAEIDAGGDVDLEAKNMTFAAAEDVYLEEKSSESIRVGLYVDTGASGEAKANAEAKAEASAEAGMSGASGSAEASAEVGASAEGSAKAGMGIQTQVAKLTETETSTTAMTSTIRSGGDITRKAEGKITDVGTDIEGDGSLNQEAAEWEFKAAQNTSSKTSSYEETTAKVGVYVEVEGEAEVKAEAKAEVGAGMGGGEASASASAKASAEGGAYAGVEVQVNRLVETEAERATEAVAGNIKMGGSVNSTSTGKTTFEGTNIEAGEDINLTASELELKAARDTYEKTTTSEEINTRAAMKVGVGGSAEAEAKASTEGGAGASAEAQGGVQVGAEMQASYDRLEENESSTTAVTSRFKGGNINLNTAGATTIEGANLEAENDVNIDAESLDFKAAQNTSAASSNSQSVETEMKVMVSVIGAAGAKGGVTADVGIGESQEQGTEAVVGSINAGNLNITTKEKTRLEGTEVDVEGDATIDAGDIELAAAKSTSSASSQEISANMSFEASSGGSFEAEIGGGFANSSESSVDSTAGTLNTGGNLTLKSKKDITLEGTDVSAGGDAVLAAANDVNVKAAYSSAESKAMGVEASVNVSKTGGGVEGSFEMESERSRTAKTGSISANNLTIAAGNNASFEGTDVSAEGDVNLAAGNNVEFKAARNTEESSSLNVSAGVGSKSKGGGDDKEEDDTGKFEASTKADDAPKKSSKEVEGNIGFGIGNSSANEAVTGGISGGNINIASGNKVSFEGTELGADDGITIDAAGDVEFNKAESTSNNFGIGLELGGGTESETTTKKDGSSETENKAKVEAGVEFGIGSSNEQGGSQITSGAGGINVRSGGNVVLEGTQMETEGRANIEAEGDITQSTVSSQSSEFGFSAKVEAEIPMEGSSTEATKKDEAESNETKSDDASSASESVKEDDAEEAKVEEPKAEEAEAEGEDKKEEEEEEEGTEVTSEVNMTFESESSSEGVSVNAKGGVNLQSGVVRGQVVGADQTVTASVRPDGTRTALIPGAVGVPAGKEVSLVGANGEALPEWVSFDSLTGAISAKPPASFKGELPIVVEVPQRDGSVKKIGIVVAQ